MICPNCDQEKEIEKPSIICYLNNNRVCNDCYNTKMRERMKERYLNPKFVQWFRLFRDYNQPT